MAVPAFRKICLWNAGTGAYGANIVQGACQYARSVRNTLVLRPDPFDTASVAIETLSGYDGVLALVPDRRTEKVFASLGLPVVSVFHHIQSKELPRVGTDEAVLGRLAAAHFLDRGHTRFAYLRAPGHAYSEDRETGFRQALRAAGRDLDFVWPKQVRNADIADRPWSRLYLNTDATGAWLAELPKPVALLAANDVYAHFASAAALLAGTGIPEHIAVLGADNDTSVCESAYVPLSSIATPSVRIGHTAAELVCAMIDGQPAPRNPILLPPVEIVSRQSTDLIAIEDPGIARALRYISENAPDAFSVGDIARAAGFSRRTLEDRFRRLLQRSPMAEVRRIRMQTARHLLVTTNLPVYLIAARVGYATQEHFCAHFKRTTGQTPTRFRREHGPRFA